MFKSDDEPEEKTQAKKASKHFDLKLTYSTVTVYEEPTEPEMRRLLKKSRYHELRYIVDPKNTIKYVWDSASAVHQEVARALGINYYESETGYINEHGFDPEFTELEYRKASLKKKASDASWLVRS